MMPDVGVKPAAQAMRMAWIVVALLFPVALLNYLDRQMLATMKSSMVHSIPSIKNKADWGAVLACFKWSYAVCSPFAGFIADRVSKKHVICLSLFIWSAVTWWTGHVTSFWELVAARALMGVSEAFYIPTALALIASHHLSATRSRAVGFHQTGIYAGQILGGFAGYAAATGEDGWRVVFSICGLAGIAYAIPLLRWLRNPESLRSEAPEMKPQVFSGTTLELAAQRNFLLLVAYFTLPAIAGWVVRDWMPDILKEKFAIGQGLAGFSAVTYVQIASIVGVVVGGWLADRWMRRNHRGRIFVSAVGMSLFLPALFGVGNAGTLTAAVVFLAVFGLGWGFFDCNNMPILCQIVRPEFRATGYGIMNFASISCGGFGDWAFGALRDQNVPLNVIFGAFAAIAAVSILIVLLIRPHDPKLLS